MFKFGPKPKSGLEKAIDDVLREMSVVNADSDEFKKMVNQLVKIHALKESETPKRLSKDTLVGVLGNVAVVGMIVTHERAHVVTTKAMQFIART